ncbi:MAG: hypothetical protein WBV36_22935 [Terriglobales bacterium]
MIGISQVITLRWMLVPLLIIAAVGCMGLLAALRPETYARYFLAEYQRRAFSGNFKALSLTGWILFSACTIAIIVLPFGSKLNFLAPVFSPLFFLVCAVAYVWWGVGLLRNPESFLKKTSEPWSRLPTWAVKCFGSLLLCGAAGFSYGFAVKIKDLLR